jgi:predicted RNA-binding protein with PIN domain
VGFLIDGSNLGGVLGGGAGARDAAGVVRRLMPWARDRRAEVVVVFDGPPRAEVAERYGALAVEWSGIASADDRIVERVVRSPARWTVVTADRELAARCRAAGARVMAARELSERVSRPSRRRPTARAAEAATDKPAPHAEERDHWRRLFGGGDEEA